MKGAFIMSRVCQVKFNVLFVVAAIAAQTMSFSAWAKDLNGEDHEVSPEELAANEPFSNSSSTQATLTFDLSANATYSGVISGAIKVVKTGSAALVLTAASDYTGGTDIQAGVIGITDGDALGSESVNIASAGRLRLDAAVKCENAIQLGKPATSSSGFSQLMFNFSSGTGEFSGAITGAGNLYPSSSSKLGTYQFGGPIALSGTLANSQTTKDAYYDFYGVVTLGGLSHNGANKGTFRFRAAGNTWTTSTVNVYTRTPQFLVEDAISHNARFTCNQKDGGSVTVAGDQQFEHLVSKDGAYACTLTASGTETSTVTLKASSAFSNASGSYALKGPLNIVYDPTDDFAWIMGGGASTMTGTFTVKGGSVSTAGTFSKLAGIAVEGSGVLEFAEGGAVTATEPLTISVATDARLKLSGGQQLTADTFTYGSSKAKGGRYYQGADGTRSDAITIDQIEGTGCVYVNAKEVVDEEATWTGGAGSNQSLSEDANWEGGVAPDFSSGGLIATFGSAGHRAEVDIEDVLFKGLVLRAAEKPDGLTNAFELCGASCVNLLSRGLRVLAPEVSEPYVYRLSVPLNFKESQLWQLPEAGDTTLDVGGKISSDSPNFELAFSGRGTVRLNESSTFVGDVIVSNATVVAMCPDAFGAYDESVPKSVRVSASGCVKFVAADEHKAFVVMHPSGGLARFVMATNATHRFRGPVTFTQDTTSWTGAAIQFPKQSVICFDGGLTLNKASTKLEMGEGTTCFITNALLRSTHQFALESGILVLGAEENYFAIGNAIPLLLNGGELRTVVPHAIWDFDYRGAASVNNKCSVGLKAKWDLCGCDQGIAGIESSSASGELHSDEPATLYLKQYVEHALAAKVTGQVSLSKSGVGTLIFNRTYETGGCLETTAGTNMFGKAGVWLGNELVADGQTAVVAFADRYNISRKTAIRVANGGKLVIPRGVRVRAVTLSVDGVERRAGVYTADTLPGVIEGEGELDVGKHGLVLMIR